MRTGLCRDRYVRENRLHPGYIALSFQKMVLGRFLASLRKARSDSITIVKCFSQKSMFHLTLVAVKDENVVEGKGMGEGFRRWRLLFVYDVLRLEYTPLRFLKSE